MAEAGDRTLPQDASSIRGTSSLTTPSPAGRGAWRFVELFALAGLALAQPLLEATGRSPEFFLFRRASRADILALVAVIVLLPPLVLWTAETLIGAFSSRGRQLTHILLVAGLLAVLAVEVLKKAVPLRGATLAGLSMVAGAGGAVVYARSSAVRQWIRYLAPAPLVFTLLFVALSPAATLVLPHRPHQASAPSTVSPAPSKGQPPVVMVFLDEFPLMSVADHNGAIDARLFPNLARLASTSTWYRNATGVSGYTPWAMPAMLTGRYPSRGVAPAYFEYPDNLFTLLRSRYRLKVFETITQLCPPSSCPPTGQPPGGTGLKAVLRDSAGLLREIVSPYDVRKDPEAQFKEGIAGDAGADRSPQQTPSGKKAGPQFRFNRLYENQPVRFRQFLTTINGSDEPTLYFLHLLLPHEPWRYLPSGLRYPYPSANYGKKDFQTWGPQAWPVLLNQQRHLLQLAFTDRLIGQVVQRLKDQGLWDRSLVLLTADHGVSFTPGQPRRRLGDRNAHEIMAVPLFVKAPHQRAGSVDSRNWEHVDLLPTVADMLGVRVPWRMDGISAVGATRRQGTSKSFYDEPGRRQVVDWRRDRPLALQGAADRVARPQDGVRGLFEVGPFRELIGRRVDSVRLDRRPGVVATVDGLNRYRQVNPATGSVPALVSGQITPATAPSPSPFPVAVALNGVIAAVGQTFHEGAIPLKFAAMVSDDLMQSGANRLQLFAVRSVAGQPELRAITLHG
jgi:hypothetical protein